MDSQDRDYKRGRHEATIAERWHGERPGHRPKHCANETDVAQPWTSAYKVAGIGPLAPGATSQAYPIYWPVSGMVREIAGSIVGDVGGANFASMGVELTILDGREAIFKSAAAAGIAGEDFSLFASLFGYDGSKRCYLNRPVYASLAWQATFRNTGVDQISRPELTFFLDEDPHGVRREWYKRVEVPVGTEIVVYGGGHPKRIMTAENT